jgi:hypothetical protein
VLRGCQNFKSTTSASMETSDPAISTTQGPCRLLTRNCVTPKLTPAVRHAGHTSSMLLRPAMAHTSQNGTITLNTGRMRPTMALSCSSGSPVTPASAISGVPSAPYATGAVLPIKAMPAACSGRNPRPISMAADIATGVPKPAAPSMNAPKLNAISRACRRRSPANPATVCLTTSKSPDWTVTS